MMIIQKFIKMNFSLPFKDQLMLTFQMKLQFQRKKAHMLFKKKSNKIYVKPLCVKHSPTS